MEAVYKLLGWFTDAWLWLDDRVDDAVAWWHNRFDRGTNA